MSNVFSIEAAKSITTPKVVLAEIDIGRENTFWINSSPGVWIVNFANAYSKLTVFTSVPTAPDILVLGSVTIDGIQLSRVTTPAMVQTTASSFYFEAGTRTLYLHLPFCSNPRYHRVRIGQVYGVRRGGSCTSYGGVLFENRLLESPTISLNKDPQFYGVHSIDNCTFRIANEDHKFDFLTRDQNVFGNKGRIFLGFDYWDLTDFKQVFEGMIGKIETSENEISVEVRDARASLSRALPVNVFSTDVYPYLNEDDIGKPIPRVFGTCRNIPVYITDQDQTTGGAGTTITYHGKIGDTHYTSAINAINAIYVNNILTVSTGKNLGTRTITLKHSTKAASQYDPGDDVTADVIGEVTSTGGVIQNGAEVTRRLLYDYYGFTYANDFYDLSKWDELRAQDVGLWMGEQKATLDWIADICTDGIQADFFVGGDGRYKLRIWDNNRASIQTIQRYEILETPKISDDPTKTMTSALIGYSKDWASGDYLLFLDDSLESDIYDKYPVYRQERFDTLLTNVTDAASYSSKVFDKSADVETLITIKVPGWICIEREIGDVVIAHVNRKNTDWYKRCKLEISGIEKDLNNHISTLTCRLIQRLDDIPYQRSWFYSSNDDIGYINYYCTDTQSQHIYYGMTIAE